jgi:hypothetical protein
MQTTKSLFVILIITMAGAARLQAQVPFTNSLVAYYPLNGNASDATGHGNNGTIIGGVVPATDRFGITSNAFHFGGSGSDAAIEVTNTLFNIGQPGYTVTCWFASDDITETYQTVWNTIPETGIAECFNTPGVLGTVGYAIGSCNGTWTDDPVSGVYANFTNDTWSQAVFTKSNTLYSLYVNGQLASQITVAAASGYNYNVGGIIGSITPINPPYPYTFLGRMNDFRFYNRALASNEVQELYSYELTTPSCTPYPAAATAIITNGFVIGATLTDSGCGYTNVPPVVIVGGGGTNATAEAIVSNGVVEGVTITDAGSNYTTAPGIYFYVPLSITGQPQPLTVAAFDNASFSVTAAGVAPLNYQWSLNGTNLLGATSSSFTISNVAQTNLGSYAVVVSDVFGAIASSNAVLSMYPYLLQPFDGLDTDWGYTNTLSVQAWGTGPLTYQWYDNGVAVTGATNQQLVFDGIQFTNAGLYSVVVSNALGSVTNVGEQVVVNPAGISIGLSPTITISGVAGYSYIIQRTTDLSNTNSWVTVTNLTLTQPVQIWADTSINTALPSNPFEYYRVLPGP